MRKSDNFLDVEFFSCYFINILVVLLGTTTLHSNLANEILIPMKLKKNLLERKTVKCYKKRENGRKEKEGRMFYFENYCFCLEENKHSFTLPISSKKKYAAIVLLQSHL